MLADLEKFDYVQLSLQPDIPGLDETIDHRLINKQVIETKTGLVLILGLENVNSGEVYSYSYSDIISVERNNHSNATFGKYYIECVNREKVYKLVEIEEKSKFNLPLTEADKELLQEGNTNLYRIICKN